MSVVVAWVGDEPEVSEVELFFICGRSKMSLTEKLDDRGILISSNLNREIEDPFNLGDKLSCLL